MSLDKNIEERLRWLDEKFRTGGKYSILDLMDGINCSALNIVVSKRTVGYDLERLAQRVDMEKECRNGKPVYFYRDSRASYFDNRNAAITIILERFLSLVSGINGLDGFTKLKEDLAALTREYKVDSSSSIISFDSCAELKGLHYLDRLYAAIRDKKPLVILSESYNRPLSEKYRRLIVHPYHLKEYANRWYLIGYTQIHGEVTCLPVDRMKSVMVADGVTYRKPAEGTDYTGWCDNRIGVGDGKMIELVLRVHPVRFRYLNSKKLHFSQEEIGIDADGWYRLKYQLVDNEELRHKILSWGPEVEVVAPVSMRNLIRKRLTQAGAFYLRTHSKAE